MLIRKWTNYISVKPETAESTSSALFNTQLAVKDFPVETASLFAPAQNAWWFLVDTFYFEVWARQALADAFTWRPTLFAEPGLNSRIGKSLCRTPLNNSCCNSSNSIWLHIFLQKKYPLGPHSQPLHRFLRDTRFSSPAKRLASLLAVLS